MSSTQKKASKSLCFAILVSLQLIGSAEASQATTSCAAVKNQVLKLEKAVRAEQSYFARYEGKKIEGVLDAAFQKSVKNSYLQQLGKLEYNNKSCFTQSQYDQILRQHFWTAPFTINFTSVSKARGLDCKNNPTSRKEIDLGKYQPKGVKKEIECDVPTYLVVDMRNYLFGKSIYSY